MKRVYTNKKFPGAQIVNGGTGTFEVYQNGQLVQSFESWETPDGAISESFAARRAQDYFERWASMDLSEEFEDQFLSQSPEAMDLTKPKASEIDNLMAQERLEQNPKGKRAIRERILNLMRQEESLAESVVNHLLGL